MKQMKYWSGGLALIVAGSVCADWVDFIDETTLRLPVPENPASLSRDDTQEKDYAWGDVDLDGDIDVVVVRKQPFTTPGKRVNVLFMNEGPAEGRAVQGIFIDRTEEYASASDLSGVNGFNTATNDRDVALADFNGDGWLDIVTAPARLTDNEAKHLSHPRIYMNLGEDGNGNWLGFMHEDDRFPLMHPEAGPRFCSVSPGDIDNDGDMDLYFTDYDSGQPEQIVDFNNRLFINDGAGFFTDETTSRLTSQMTSSGFGASSSIVDFNNDGAMDIMRQQAGSVDITYNDPDNPGFFESQEQAAGGASYFASTADLNNDGRMDIIIGDDGTDRYLINTGNGADGRANFVNLQFPPGPSAGFPGNNIGADLNNDGFIDAIMADVDVDISGCGRHLRIYRNLGNLPNVTMSHQSEIGPPGGKDPTGVHDVAVFDINGDGWLDMWIGRCNSTEIWINDPPLGLQFTYPLGLPGFITPGDTATVTVQLNGIGGEPMQDSAMLHYALNGGEFTTVPMVGVGVNQYAADLPSGECLDTVEYFVTASLESGSEFSDPENAPFNTYQGTFAEGLEEIFVDDMEGDVSGWSTTAEALDSGAWEVADPVGTTYTGAPMAPDEDASAAPGAVMAWVTQNSGTPGEDPGLADVDGGPATLYSPIFDLEGTDATISYKYWHTTTIGLLDALSVEISGDGVEWMTVEHHGNTGGEWIESILTVSEHIVPTATVQVRFVVVDLPNDSYTESGVDEFRVTRLVCGETGCDEDLDDDGIVGASDLAALLAAWGSNPGEAPDFDGSGTVDAADLATLLAAWGACGG